MGHNRVRPSRRFDKPGRSGSNLVPMPADHRRRRARPCGPRRAPLAGRLGPLCRRPRGRCGAPAGPGPGSRPAQLRFANGARVELLMPYDTEVNDFLAAVPRPQRARAPPPDLQGARPRRGHRTGPPVGCEPIGVDLSHPEWMEAFIHPKQATGVVVQLAQAPARGPVPRPTTSRPSDGSDADGSGPPGPRRSPIRAHVVADIARGHPPLPRLAGRRSGGRGQPGGCRWVDLTWGGPLGLRLVAPTGPSPGLLRTGSTAAPAGSTISSSR